MITTIRTCDKCKTVIPAAEYNLGRVATIHIGHYDRTGTRLEFCQPCWEATYVKHTKEPPLNPELSHTERICALLTELIELVTPHQQQ